MLGTYCPGIPTLPQAHVTSASSCPASHSPPPSLMQTSAPRSLTPGVLLQDFCPCPKQKADGVNIHPAPHCSILGQKCAFKISRMLDWEPQCPGSPCRTRHVWWLERIAPCPVMLVMFSLLTDNSSAVLFYILINLISMVDLMVG